MTSESEGYQSSEYGGEPNHMHITAKSYAVADQTERLQKQIEKLELLHSQISAYKDHHVDTVYELREHITDLSRELGISGKNLVSMCEARLKEISKEAEPYLLSGQDPSGQKVTDKCIEVLSKIQGLTGPMKKTEELSNKVRQQHHLVNRIEEKQKEAISRHSRITNLEALSHGVAAEDPMFHVANLPITLLALARAKHVSEYYQKTFESLQERVVAFMMEHRQKAPFESSIAIPTSSVSTGTNGEISVNSLHELSEHPLDEPITTPH